MTRSPRPPFAVGDPAAVELGRKGGKSGAANRQAKAAADPLTRGLLGEVLTYSTSDWMERLGLTGPSWESWRIVGQVLDGLPLSATDQAIYAQLTGRTTVPSDLRELWVLAGRGSGKTSFMALCAVKAACRGYLGVRGVPRILLLAFVLEQSGIAFSYVEEFFDRDRELRKLIVSPRSPNVLTLAHGVRIQTIASCISILPQNVSKLGRAIARAASGRRDR